MQLKCKFHRKFFPNVPGQKQLLLQDLKILSVLWELMGFSCKPWKTPNDELCPSSQFMWFLCLFL